METDGLFHSCDLGKGLLSALLCFSLSGRPSPGILKSAYLQQRLSQDVEQFWTHVYCILAQDTDSQTIRCLDACSSLMLLDKDKSLSLSVLIVMSWACTLIRRGCYLAVCLFFRSAVEATFFSLSGAACECLCWDLCFCVMVVALVFGVALGHQPAPK